MPQDETRPWDGPKTETVQFRVTATERKLMNDTASSRGMTVAYMLLQAWRKDAGLLPAE